MKVVIAEMMKNETGGGKLSKNCTARRNFSPEN
jgi:hypothetical protein